MKKMILTAAVIAAAVMTVSCNKDSENIGLSVDAEAINYPLSGGTYDINLTSGKPWKALFYAEWLTVTPESGAGDATVTVGTDIWANEDSEEVRLADVYFTDDTDTVSVLIGQSNDNNSAPATGTVSNNTNYLYLSDYSIREVPYQGGSYVIGLNTNTNWWIENDNYWLTFSTTGGSYKAKEFTVIVRAWIYPDKLALTSEHHDSNFTFSEDTRTLTFYVAYESQPGVVSRRPVQVTQRGR